MDPTPYTPGWFLEILLRPLTRLLEFLGIPGIFSVVVLGIVLVALAARQDRKKDGGFTIRFYLTVLLVIAGTYGAIMAVVTGQYQMP